MKETELVKAGKLRRGEGENFHKILFFNDSGAKCALHTHTQNKQTKALTHTEVLQ